MWIPIVISFAAWIIVNGVIATVDGRRNEKGAGILFKYHLFSWIIRYIIGFLLITFVWHLGNVPYVDDIDASFFPRLWHAIWANREVWGVFIIKGAIAWFWFDFVYLLFRPSLPLTHVGTSSWLDKIFHKFKNPFVAQMIAKCILLAAGLIMYFI
jgi:hypothetical protein